MNGPDRLPAAFEERMAQQLGDAYTGFSKALAADIPTAIRLNPIKPVRSAEAQRSVPWCAEGRYLAERPKFNLDPLWHAGAYYVQDASSMFLGQLWQWMDLPADPLVLDACAAPGGKSTHLLSLMAGSGLLVANEVIPKRNRILVENIVKWGYANQVVLEAGMSDLAKVFPSIASFDVVVVDAPCSGEGLFRKDSIAIREWSREHVLSCARRQALILEDVSALVRPGGYLIYSTCTWSEAENEDQVENLLASGNWQLAGPADYREPGPLPGRNGTGWRFYPHRSEGEGFYCALLQRSGGSGTVTREVRPPDHDNVPPSLDAWIQAGGLAVLRRGSNISLFPAAHLDLLDRMERSALGSRLRYSGILAGTEVHDMFKPAHSLALSAVTKASVPFLDLDREQAEAYLRKAALPVSLSDTPGWSLVRYKGVNLGWVKVLGNRINNYYPKQWSIRP